MNNDKKMNVKVKLLETLVMHTKYKKGGGIFDTKITKIPKKNGRRN